MRDPVHHLLADALAAGSTAVEVYARRAETLVWSWAPATGATSLRRSVRAVAVRLFREGGVRFLAGPEGDRLFAGRLEPPLPVRGRRAVPPPNPPPASRSSAPGAPLELGDRRVYLRSIERELIRLSGGAVRLLSAELREGVRHQRVATSGGTDVSDESSGFRLAVRVTGEHDGHRLSATEIDGGRALPEPTIVAARAVDRILYPLRGKDLPDKRAEILADPAVGAALLEGISAAFLAGRRPEGWPGASLLKDGRLGSPALTILDDGTLPEGPDPQRFDGEGYPQRMRVVLEQGVPAELLTDSRSAAGRGLPSTGNALRESWREPPRLSPSQLYVAPDAAVSAADLLADVRFGYFLVASMGRGDFDLAADRFSLPVTGVYLQKGRARYPIRPSVLAGRISELLRSVKAVGNDLSFRPLSAWYGAPTMLLTGLRLS